MKRFLALLLTMVLLLGAVPAQNNAQAAATTTATVKGGWLRLRSGASYNATTITSYYTGTVVNILGTSGAWYHVTTPDGRTGYMHGNYLTLGGTPSGNENIAATVVSANGLGVRMRTGPSTAYGVIAKYPVGTSATILSSGTYWHYISINGRKGYMMSQFLSTGSAPVTPSSSYTAYVTSQNGLGVRLRSGAGKGYAVLGLYSVGTEVTVLQHNRVWDYIRVGSRTGYMMNEFLTTTNTNKNITGVVLSNAKPVVGETLSANVLPSGASVSYEWADDRGLLLGTGSTYTIQSGDVGRKIRVRVTGSNGYAGSAVSSFAQVSSAPATALTAVTLDNANPYVGLTLTATVDPAAATATYKWMRDDGTQVGTARSYTVQAGDIGHALYCVATGNGSYTGSVISAWTKAAVDNKPVENQNISGTITLPSAIMPGVKLEPRMAVNCSSLNYQWYVGGVVVSTDTTLWVTDDMAGKPISLVVSPTTGSGYAGQVESNVCSVMQGSVATTTDL